MKNRWVEKISQYFAEGKKSMPTAIQMLKEDHGKVKGLFEQFERAEDGGAKRHIVETTISELQVHAAVEEEIFYPKLRQAIDEEEKVDEAEEEHHVMKLLLSELETMGPDDDKYDAKYKVLAESVKHHIEEEESEIFPEVEDELDSPELGEKMAERKEELQREMLNDAAAKRLKKPAGRSQRKGEKNHRTAARRH